MKSHQLAGLLVGPHVFLNRPTDSRGSTRRALRWPREGHKCRVRLRPRTPLLFSRDFAAPGVTRDSPGCAPESPALDTKGTGLRERGRMRPRRHQTVAVKFAVFSSRLRHFGVSYLQERCRSS